MKAKTALPVFVLLAFMVFAANQSYDAQTNNIAVKYTSKVCVSVNGELKGCTHNVLTDSGRQMIKNFLRGLTPQTANISVIALGNGSAPTASSTVLDSEITGCGLDNVTAINNNINNTAWDLSYQWTSTCDNIVVNTTAIFNATADGIGSTMFAGATITSSTLQNTDKIQVNYTINVG